MSVDWRELVREVGSTTSSGERGGDYLAQTALERIVGLENIRSAVEHVLASEPGSELAMGVLSYIRSLQATELAYKEYGSVDSSLDRAQRAVYLIAHIAHPRSLEWVEDFLSDERVAGWGITLLDNLLIRRAVDRSATQVETEVERLLAIADRHPSEHVREYAGWIRANLLDGAK